MTAAACSAVLALGGCSAGSVSPDAAELNNMWRANLVPKATPAQMVGTFDRFCVNGSTDPGQAERDLRAAEYIPLPNSRTPGARAWVEDDEAPAVALSDTMCVVAASSRSGQTDRFRRYVAETFPQARAVDPTPLGNTIEQAWEIGGDAPFLIATERTPDVDWYRYMLILYRPEGRA
ncbi:hypothetical protein [Roseobacter sp. S98]|uniref:hypothetical protein n=1 Tax=Roseobacter algicola (ex Choi et al. 2025) (nom. illeg.) TaxID=3092138 RepID=UPI0035C78526